MDGIIPEDNPLSDAAAMHQTIMRLSLASRRRLALDLEPINLTVPQYTTLRTLHHNPDGCSMSSLAENSFQLSATMTGIVDRLVERDLVQRKPDPADRRSQVVSLTESGYQLMNEFEKKQVERLEAVFRFFSAQERSELLRLMELYLSATTTDIQRLEGSDENNPGNAAS